ncbi:MAG: hypothetical protein CM15mV25_0080 [uncultured marine virus]|nr:MAG: hypothetical protein CM15mV25_0080 [uncultured marine virus]
MKPVGIPKGTINYDYVVSKHNPHPNKKGHECANYIKLHGFNSQRVEEKNESRVYLSTFDLLHGVMYKC